MNYNEICTEIFNFKDSSLNTYNYYISWHDFHNVVDLRKQEGRINYIHIITFLNKDLYPYVQIEDFCK